VLAIGPEWRQAAQGRAYRSWGAVLAWTGERSVEGRASDRRAGMRATCWGAWPTTGFLFRSADLNEKGRPEE